MKEKKILIVEDEHIFAEDIKLSLKDIGFDDCIIEGSAEKALEVIRKQKPSLILIDIKLMGKMDGIELAEHIKKTKKIPVIYITAYADEKTYDEAMATKPIAYFTKPLSETELLEVITKTLLE